jgi:hypothetical protein
LGKETANYPAYVLGEDGLPSPANVSAGSSAVKPEDFPPFPLKHLMDFFVSVNTGKRVSPGGGGTIEYISIILLFFVLPGFFLKGKINFPAKIHFEGLKRFSLKLRWTDINRKKVLLYNGRNTLKIRKEA